MADITVTTDFTEVNNLNNALKSTESLFVKVVDSLFREEARARSVTKKLAKTTEENLSVIAQAEAIVAEKVRVESDKREKARTREAARAEKEAQRIIAAAEKAAKAEAALTKEIERNQSAAGASFTSGANARLGVTGPSAMQSGAGFGAIESEIERLRQKYDTIYASSQLYERSLQELNKAHMLGVTSAKQHESAVESLNLEYQAFQNGVAQAGNRFAQHVNQTSTGMNNFGVAAQQTGYQVSDFIVQVQSGTNPLVAFSQQATQLAGLLYLLPPSMQAARIGMAGFSISMATATAGLTILIPLLAMIAMNFIGSGKESEEASAKIDKQAQAYETLIQRVEELRLARQMEATGIQTQEEQITQNLVNDLLEERSAILEKINNLEYAGGTARGAAQKQNAEAQRDLLQAELDKNQAAIDAIEYERQLSTAARRRANEQRNDSREAKAAADDLYDRLFQITQIDLGSVFSEASPFAQNLLSTVNGLYESMQRAAQVAAVAASGVAGRVGDTDRGGQRTQVRSAAEYNTSVIMDRLNPRPDSSGGGTGGGGGGTSGVDALINQLQSEREIVEEWYVESQEILTSASESELAIIGGYNEAKLRLAQEYQDRLAGINGEGNKTQLENYLGGAGEILGAMGAFSDKALKVSKAFAAAEALVSTYQGAAAELKKGTFGFASAAAVIAKGLGFVAAIRGITSSGSTGGGGGGGRGSASVSTQASAPTPQTVLIDSITPDSLYSGQTLINLFEAFYDENDKRGKVFVVAR